MLANTLRKLKQLRKLCVADTLITVTGVKQLSYRLSTLQLLELLDMSNNRLVGSFGAVSEVILALPSQHHLALNNVRLEMIVDLNKFHCLIGYLTNLQSLVYIKNPVSYELLNSIGSMISLRILVLSEFGTKPADDQIVLRESTEKLVNLKKLDLSRNWLNGMANTGVAFPRCLSVLQRLTWLSLSDIGKKRSSQSTGVAAGLRGLRRAHKLQYLDISCNEFVSSEENEIARVVCALTSL